MGEVYPQLDDIFPLATIQAKLTTFSRHCNDLLQESTCLLDEIAKFSDLISLFTPLNSALEAFLLESPRFGAYFKTLEASCSQEEETLLNNSVRFGITKEEEIEAPVIDSIIVSQRGAENVPLALPKLRIRLRKAKPPCRVMAKKEMMMNKKRLVGPNVARSISTAAYDVAAGLPQKPRRGVFTCEVCDTRIMSKWGLQRHMTRWHSGAKFSNGAGDVETKPKATLEQRKASGDCSLGFRCEVCGTRTARKWGLKRHMIRLHSGSNVVSNGASGVETKLKAKLAQHKISLGCSSVFQCAVCAVVKSNRAYFYQHLRSHTNRFTCYVCQAQLRTKAHLQQHLRSHPDDGLSFTCDRCGYKTNKKGSLIQHLKYCNKPDKAFQCAVCGVVKDSKKRLAEHISLSHPKDLIMCEICSKLLKSNLALKLHLQAHAALRTLKCGQCDYRTWSKSNLRVHQLTHGGRTLRCPHVGCTVVVKRRCALRAHIQRSHSDGARPFACDRCEWAFANSQDLKRHLQSHAGERPYPCLICGYPFSRPSNRKVHMRTVHKLDPSDPRLQPSLPAAYSSVADGDAPVNSADVALALQSDFPADKIRHRRRREPLFLNKKHSTSRVSVTASSKQVGLPYHVRSADRRAVIISTNQITEISANQAASVISANQVAINPASQLAFNQILTLPESIPSTAAAPSYDVASFYNPQFLDYQFQSFSGHF